jgi:hypothetical protein
LIGLPELIQIQFSQALVALDSASEDLMPALGTNIASFFILDPFFGTDLAPMGDRAQNYFFADGHGKMINVPAWKFIALMTSGVTFFPGAVPDLALPAVHEQYIGQAATAFDVFHGEIFAVGETAFVGYPALIKIDQALLEFVIVIAVGHINGADSAIKTAG